jgi:hypothetical protein
VRPDRPPSRPVSPTASAATSHESGRLDRYGRGAAAPLPATVDAALAYLAEALGHPVYAHWTLTRIKRRYGSLADAKAAQPTVLKLLLAHDGAVEYWERGRLRTAPADLAPSPERSSLGCCTRTGAASGPPPPRRTQGSAGDRADNGAGGKSVVGCARSR